MASGLLGKAAVPASTYTLIFTAAAAKVTTANIRCVNRDKINAITARLAVVPNAWVAGAPADEDWIVCPDFTIPPGELGGITEDIAIAMSAGEKLVAFSTSSTLTVRAHGFEKTP